MWNQPSTDFITSLLITGFLALEPKLDWSKQLKRKPFAFKTECLLIMRIICHSGTVHITGPVNNVSFLMQLRLIS